jgi:hypothetical protein
MLMDPDGYSAWERHMVRRCHADAFPESVVATLAVDVTRLRDWRPGGISLTETIRLMPDALVPAAPDPSLSRSLGLRTEVVEAIPDDLKPADDDHRLEDAYRNHVRPVWSAFARPINRYLAAKAFASWTAYQGRGLATIVRGLDAALALVRIESARQCRDSARALDRNLLLEAVRSADFALNHLAVGEELAAVWSRAEDHC